MFVGGTAITSNVTAKTVGPMRRVLGYVPVAHRRGTAMIIVSVAALFFGFATPQGLILGFQ